MRTRAVLAGADEARELRAALDRYEAARLMRHPSRADAERAVKYPLSAFGVFRHRGRAYWWDTDDDSLVRGYAPRKPSPPQDAPRYVQHYTFHRRGVMPDDDERILWTNYQRGRAV